MSTLELTEDEKTVMKEALGTAMIIWKDIGCTIRYDIAVELLKKL